jgi:hypothetical protein
MQPQIIVLILLAHYVADFLLQSRYMADNKSHRFDVLSFHVSIYGMMLTLILFPIFMYAGVPAFDTAVYLLLNTILHLITDYFTSKASSRAFSDKNIYKGMAIIGFDQFIHSTCLLVSYLLLLV